MKTRATRICIQSGIIGESGWPFDNNGLICCKKKNSGDYKMILKSMCFEWLLFEDCMLHLVYAVFIGLSLVKIIFNSGGICCLSKDSSCQIVLRATVSFLFRPWWMSPGWTGCIHDKQFVLAVWGFGSRREAYEALLRCGVNSSHSPLVWEQLVTGIFMSVSGASVNKGIANFSITIKVRENSHLCNH